LLCSKSEGKKRGFFTRKGNWNKRERYIIHIHKKPLAFLPPQQREAEAEAEADRATFMSY
jgi:hypothetical protein